MSDYISRQDALDALKHDEEYDEDIPNRADGVRDAIITISNLPTADVVKRKRGEWQAVNIDAQSWTVHCSNCHCIGLYGKTAFCPNCGARMEVDE